MKGITSLDSPFLRGLSNFVTLNDGDIDIPTLGDELLMDVTQAVNSTITQACKDSEMSFLSDDEREPYNEVMKALPDAIRIIERGAERIRFLRTHQHENDGDDYCIHCRSDLRA